LIADGFATYAQVDIFRLTPVDKNDGSTPIKQKGNVVTLGTRFFF
jgi:hypothetical protein